MMDKMSVVKALQTAAPFIEMFKDATFVVKLGGAAIRDRTTLESIMSQVRMLQLLGIRLVVVHGGGEQVTRLSDRLGISTTMVAGRRVTDESALEAVTMILNGTINTNIISAGRKAGIDAIGVSGISSSIVTARRRPPVEMSIEEKPTVVDFGHVGDIVEVDVSTLKNLLDSGRIPVLSPLSADSDGNVLNVNADTVAAAIAIGLKAEKLIYVSTPRGLMSSLGDAMSLISLIDVQELNDRISGGAISDGMLPKVASAIEALEQGVDRAHFISFTVEDSLLLEVLTSEGCGTMIVNNKTSAKATVSDS